MGKRYLLPVFLFACTTPCFADDQAIVNIGDAIAAYRLTAPFCHWPIPSKIGLLLNSDEAHFRAKNPKAFKLGEAQGKQKFDMLTHSLAADQYCREIKQSRDEMTQSLETRAK